MADNLEGAFKDYENNFSCNTVEEWQKHLSETEVTHRGSSKCVTCGEMIENYVWKGKLKNGKLYPTLVCKGCKEQ